MTPAEAIATARQIKMTARAVILLTRGGQGAAQGAATTAVAAGMGALKTALSTLASKRGLPLTGYSTAEIRNKGASLVEAKIRPYRDEIRSKLKAMTDLYKAISDLAGLV